MNSKINHAILIIKNIKEIKMIQRNFKSYVIKTWYIFNIKLKIVTLYIIDKLWLINSNCNCKYLYAFT